MKLVRTTASALVIRSLPVLRENTDTGKRLIHNQAATAFGDSYDEKWTFVQAPAGSGWVSTAHLDAVPMRPTAGTITIPPKWPAVPHGRDAIIALFGEPCKPVCEAGRVTLPDTLKVSWGAERITRFACHELLVQVFTSVFKEIHRRDYWSLLTDFGGCYNCREQRGTTAKTSTHSWGIAVDLNAKANPLGAPPKMPAPIIAIFTDHGFTWGGTWHRPDGMHFQYAAGY